MLDLEAPQPGGVASRVPPGVAVEIELLQLGFVLVEEKLGVVDADRVFGADGIDQGHAAGGGKMGKPFAEAVEYVKDALVLNGFLAHFILWIVPSLGYCFLFS